MRQQWKPLVHFLPRDCWNHLCLKVWIPHDNGGHPEPSHPPNTNRWEGSHLFPSVLLLNVPRIFFLRFASQQLVCTFAIEHLIRPDADDGRFSRCSLSRDFFPEHRRAWQLGQKNWSNLIHSEKAEILFRSFLLTEFIFRERARRRHTSCTFSVPFVELCAEELHSVYCVRKNRKRLLLGDNFPVNYFFSKNSILSLVLVVAHSSWPDSRWCSR